MAEQFSIACGVVRKEYKEALRRILNKGVLLIDIDVRDLVPVRRFGQHIKGCAGCRVWEKEKRDHILQSVDD